jgi:hypothetical protein
MAPGIPVWASGDVPNHPLWGQSMRNTWPMVVTIIALVVGCLLFGYLYSERLEVKPPVTVAGWVWKSERLDSRGRVLTSWRESHSEVEWLASHSPSFEECSAAPTDWRTVGRIEAGYVIRRLPASTRQLKAEDLAGGVRFGYRGRVLIEPDAKMAAGTCLSPAIYALHMPFSQKGPVCVKFQASSLSTAITQANGLFWKLQGHVLSERLAKLAK